MWGKGGWVRKPALPIPEKKKSFLVPYLLGAQATAIDYSFFAVPSSTQRRKEGRNGQECES